MSTVKVNDIRKLIDQVNFKGIEYSNSDSLFDIGILDSLKTIQLILLIEKKMNITIDQADLKIEDFENVDLLVDYINKRIDKYEFR
ncbi:MAG: acyl carrier protein [Clostridia bacterium]|nr:acyl carrier protein [Clostridia bacterium]